MGVVLPPGDVPVGGPIATGEETPAPLQRGERDDETSRRREQRDGRAAWAPSRPRRPARRFLAQRSRESEHDSASKDPDGKQAALSLGLGSDRGGEMRPRGKPDDDGGDRSN